MKASKRNKNGTTIFIHQDAILKMWSEWRLEKKLACDFCVTWTTFRD